MKPETEYRYKKRIKELQSEKSDLLAFKSLAVDLFDEICGCIMDNTVIKQGWIVKQFRRVFK